MVKNIVKHNIYIFMNEWGPVPHKKNGNKVDEQDRANSFCSFVD